MEACRRGQTPALLAEHCAALSAAYVQARRLNARHEFRWRTDVYDAVCDALRAMTNAHCSYCDGDLRPATVAEEIDHFRPRSNPEFFELICDWHNLFLVCSPCNKNKGHRWHSDLLRPDDWDYAFGRYFDYDFQRHQIVPRADASPPDQDRARITIDLLRLNDGKHRASRERELARADLLGETFNREDAQYRFLIPAPR